MDEIVQFFKHFRCDVEAGVITRALTTGGGRWKAGAVAGDIGCNGYWRVHFNGKRHYAHRIIWLFATGKWPTNSIDHIDGNPLNNSISNLRDVPHAINMQNRRHATKGSNSGMLGAYPRGGKWQAKIKLAGERQYLGTFSTPELANAAYLHAKQKLEGRTL